MTNAAAAAVRSAKRYGDTAGRRRRNLFIMIALAAFIVLVMLAWVIWVGLGGDAGSLQATDGGDNVIDKSHVSLSVTVDAPAGAKVSCAVEAQNVAFTVVGYDVVHLPASKRTTRTFTKELVTYEPAVSASLDKCWLP